MLNFHSNFLYVHVKCYCLFLDEVFTVLFLRCTAQQRHHEDGIQTSGGAEQSVEYKYGIHSTQYGSEEQVPWIVDDGDC